MEELINKLQYYLGQLGKEFLSSTNQRYSSPLFQKIEEVADFISYLTGPTAATKDPLYLQQLQDFIEARYNLNDIPYIQYPNRVTNILYGIGVPGGSMVFSGVNEAPFNSLLHARINGQWQVISVTDSYTKIESDALYYPLGSNPSNYLITETDPVFTASPAFNITNQNITNWNTAFGWGNHASAGYALASNSHNPITLGTANGLSLSTQVLSLALVTVATNGAMSAADKSKLDNITVHDPVTIGTANGLSLNTQALSLALSTTSTAGAMSASDKIKLDSLVNYTHPTGFTNQPTNPLTGASVISRISVNTEGHITGVSTRTLTQNDLGISPNALTKTDDTNVTLTLGGTPATSLLQAVSLTLGWTGELAVSRGGTGASTFTSGEVLIGNGINPVSTLSRNGIDTRTTFPASTHTLTSHTDVNLATPTLKQVLQYNGTVWTNATLNLSDFTFTELDPVFVTFRDTIRTAKTFYSAPTASNAIATFRAIITDDLPDVYVRFDIPQTLTELEKQRVRTTLGVNNLSGSFEPAFSKGDIITTTSAVISLTNGVDRLVGLSDLIINHATSGWVAKTTLTGANIISNLTVDTYGHISNWTTRVLTLADLGFVAFDPTSIEATLTNHENRITTLETNFPLLQGDKNFVHVQATAAVTWTFTHNLGKKPSVTIIDSAGSIILAKITYTNLNSITIDFNGSATSGEAICN